ncbi:M15 family metallopeptidase [Nocardioides mangrovi]|uniref:M15 family metallopeptidase n=1 Tax=Nocardioides mangrovi TaxID=2874580 RepID=A0ABS7UAX0_9ACTN|nr:M15 family metallopeptidase [Nocardioides mangrovi]MBZ5737833.1 M15 family metallopeptidase [Nocardioides mangrovi]
MNLFPVLLALTLTITGCSGSEAADDLPAAKRPTIAHLDPDLRAAVVDAAADARADGVRVSVTSGWRSKAHQERLLEDAVQKYGSVSAALHWVSTPDTSAHVTGDAVDIGPNREADAWLSEHGSAYGLCQTFANEPWHFELATDPGGDCPEMLPDSSYRESGPSAG